MTLRYFFLESFSTHAHTRTYTDIFARDLNISLSHHPVFYVRHQREFIVLGTLSSGPAAAADNAQFHARGPGGAAAHRLGLSYRNDPGRARSCSGWTGIDHGYVVGDSDLLALSGRGKVGLGSLVELDENHGHNGEGDDNRQEDEAFHEVARWERSEDRYNK